PRCPHEGLQREPPRGRRDRAEHAGDRVPERRRDRDRARRDHARVREVQPPERREGTEAARAEGEVVSVRRGGGDLPTYPFFTRYTSCVFPGTRSIALRASRSSFVPSMYHEIEPSNFPFKASSTAWVSSSWVSSFPRRIFRIVDFIASYFARSMRTPFFPCGWRVRTFSSMEAGKVLAGINPAPG